MLRSSTGSEAPSDDGMGMEGADQQPEEQHGGAKEELMNGEDPPPQPDVQKPVDYGGKWDDTHQFLSFCLALVAHLKTVITGFLEVCAKYSALGGRHKVLDQI